MDLFETDTCAVVGAPEVRLPGLGCWKDIFLDDNNNLQRIRLVYLRLASGHVPNAALLREFKGAPLVCHWPRLVLRFSNQSA